MDLLKVKASQYSMLPDVKADFGKAGCLWYLEEREARLRLTENTAQDDLETSKIFTS